MEDCIFCKIAKYQADAHIVYEDSTVLAILDTDPISDGHTLIIPKKHVPGIHKLSDEIGTKIMHAAKVLAGIIENTFNYDGIMIMGVSGTFQDVPHFHLHVFGRKKTNDIEMKFPVGTNRDPQHLIENATKIKAGYQKLVA